MLSYRTIQPHTLELLKGLMASDVLKPLRLVGGTSLALQLGHRQSIDLDLFGQMDFDHDELRHELENLGDVKIQKESKNINIYYIDGVKVDIVNYSYPWIKDGMEEDGIRLASIEDIAAMKIAAIDGRGSKKDFIDLHYLLQKFSLNDILLFYQNKYPDHAMFRVLMSLSYFDDAESQPMPLMFENISWDNIKTFLLNVLYDYKA